MTKDIIRKASRNGMIKRPQGVVRKQSDIARSNSRLGLDPELTVSFNRHSATSCTFEVDALQLEIITLMEETQIPTELIYAYMRTGLIVTQENYENLTPADQRAWDRAIAEYFARFTRHS